ncbi:MAG: hypothetical protein ACKOX6_16040 [Bdellovibrio sp.]
MRHFILKNIARLLFISASLLFSAACSIDLNITSPISDPLEVVGAQRTEVDFTSSEIITTGNGVVFSGSFGEVAEKKVLANGVSFDGVFYE